MASSARWAHPGTSAAAVAAITAICLAVMIVPAPAQKSVATASGATPKAVSVDTAVVITGRAPQPTGRRVLLERRVPGGWLKVDADKTDKAGRFSVRPPTGWYAKHALRLRAPKTKSSKAWVRSRSLQVVPTYEPKGSPKAYKFFARGTRWDPCRAITWAYNDKGGFDGARSLLTIALAEITRATGLRYKYVGRTKQVPLRGSAGTGPDLLIGWTTPTKVKDLRGSVAGVARYYSFGRSSSKQEIYLADVALDTTEIDNLAKAMGPDENGRASWGQLFTHELGHTVGLDHTSPENQLMNAFVSAKNPRLGRGDLAGMAKKGARNGCWNQTSRSPGPRRDRVAQRSLPDSTEAIPPTPQQAEARRLGRPLVRVRHTAV